ncbi:DUF4232 domain-containing protein [Paracidobacterium acidisoli]|uniref:DUF4232 domain-containing protein n=1 Tax=Paracidobacterium acidisoli TaxID=2303751 RepID=UPI0013147359|nr:DUF4232 domain-containing protein [Paracidobacterium acidisoli]MBT9332740.1 DUF4232 domain-containing protein [Paracidobacterium acidisoli]
MCAYLAAGALAIALAGCAGSHRMTAANLKPAALAPDDAPLHPNRNAPYTMPASAPQLVARPTADDAANAAACGDEVLSVSEIAANVNGAYRSVKLAFMNRGAAACRLGGYPEIALLNEGGDRIGSIAIDKVSTSAMTAEMTPADAMKGMTKTAAVSTPAVAAPEVVLMPHSVAAFQVIWQFGPECPAVSQIEVTAPGTTKTFTISRPLTVCAGRIQVTALQPDAGDI